MYGEWLPFYPVPFYLRYMHRVGTKNSSVSVILSVHKLNLSLCQSWKITRAVAAIIILYAGLRIVWMTTIWGWLLLHMPAYAPCSIHLRKYSSYMTLFIESRTYMIVLYAGWQHHLLWRRSLLIPACLPARPVYIPAMTTTVTMSTIRKGETLSVWSVVGFGCFFM